MTRIFVSLLLAAAAAAQQPRISNARLETRSAAGGLEREFRSLVNAQTAPAWIGYAVPMVAGDRQMCCFSSNYCCGGCALESGRPVAQPQTRAGPVQLEGSGYLAVLFRIEQNAVGKIRTFSQDCELEAGGLPVYWLTGVRAAESIALLASFATAPEGAAQGRDQTRAPAVTAIALHADPAADQALEGFVARGQPESLRRHAAFWLGAARGRRGFEVLRRLVREDLSDKLRERAIFALSISKEPEAVDVMIAAARQDKSPHVRGQALFWLANKAGQKAAGAITEAIANDPETEVKKRAVFALSQLPRDESVRLLIEVARTNRNPVVRKQAIFWLGQSRDPRAMDFLEGILTR